MSPSKRTAAIGPRLEEFQGEEHHEEEQKLERIQQATEEMHLNDSKFETLPASRYRENRDRIDTNSTEIYFAPRSVSSFSAELSDPLQEPRTPYHREGIRAASDMPLSTQCDQVQDIPTGPSATPSSAGQSLKSNGSKLTLRPTDLDRLVFALANAPTIRKHVEAEAAPPSQRKTPAYPLVISKAHDRVLESRCCDSVVELGYGNALADAPTSPRRIVNEIAPIRSTFVRLRMTLSTTNQADCCLKIRTDAAEPGKPRVRISVELSTDLLVRKTGQRIYNMFTEIDVTESFRGAAFEELINHAGCALEDVVWDAGDSGETSGITGDTTSDEYKAGIIDVVAGILSDLNPETCTMESLTLMSELARIKRKYQHCAIVLNHTYHANGVPASSSMPWVSEPFDETMKRRSEERSDHYMHRFEVAMMEGTGGRSLTQKSFTNKVWIAWEKKSVFFVPLFLGPSRRTAGWACFVRDLCDVGL